MHFVTLMTLAPVGIAHLSAVVGFATPSAAAVLFTLLPTHAAIGFLAPVFQVPNFFCNLVTLIKPWVAGAIMVGLLAVACGFGLRFVMPEASMQLTNGLKGVGVALFIAGIALTPASLTAIATMFGAGSLTFCP
jgi:hypothetical protein